MSTRRAIIGAATVSGLILVSGGLGGCRALRAKNAEAADQQASATEPGGAAPDASTNTPSATVVVDERPSTRYRVEERSPTKMRSTDDPIVREPALTPEDLIVSGDSGTGGGTREARALASAKELRAMGDIQSALAELERAIAINPRFTPALLEAGDLHMEMGEVALAERSYAAAARTQPRNYDTQYRHATALKSLNRSEEAVRAYLRALAVRPNEFDAMLGLSTAYLESGDAEQSLPYAERSARSRPRSGEARMHLGNVYAGLDRHEEAVIEYRQAAELLPKPAPGLLLNMAESFSRLGRYAEMVGALNEVVATAPTPVAYERLGSGMFRLRRYDEALSAFRASADLDTTYAPALNGIAVCELNNYLWSGKEDGMARERAVDAMRQSLRIDRRQPKIVELLRRYSNAAPQERAG
ncbi:MAG: tetratricopeptide repeat protein [Phycisphaerales bacterium]